MKYLPTFKHVNHIQARFERKRNEGWVKLCVDVNEAICFALWVCVCNRDEHRSKVVRVRVNVIG